MRGRGPRYGTSACWRGRKDALADGRIRHLGFSFHDKYEVFQEIVDAYDAWTFCQIQYNYLDIDYQAGARGLKYAADKGPGRRGDGAAARRLAGRQCRLPAGARRACPGPDAVGQGSRRAASPAEWALQWVWNQPEVSLVLSGMSNAAQLEENLASADRSGVGTLTEAEEALVGEVRTEFQRLAPIPCTECKYCQPCPNGVQISQHLRLL